MVWGGRLVDGARGTGVVVVVVERLGRDAVWRLGCCKFLGQILGEVRRSKFAWAFTRQSGSRRNGRAAVSAVIRRALVSNEELCKLDERDLKSGSTRKLHLQIFWRSWRPVHSSAEQTQQHRMLQDSNVQAGKFKAVLFFPSFPCAQVMIINLFFKYYSGTSYVRLPSGFR